MATHGLQPSKLTLWEIETGLLELLEAREEAQTPEAIAAVEQALAEYVTREVEKVDNIRGLIRHCEMVATAARQEARDQAERARVWEARRDRVKQLAQNVMEAHGRKRLEGRTGSLQVTGNGGVEPLVISDPAQVPEECCKYVGWIRGDEWMTMLEILTDADWSLEHFEGKLERVVDNDRTRKAIAEQGGVPGATLGERGKHLEVK
jgi:hypothetical protein